MYVLVINAGSSSLKYQLVEKQTLAVAAKGLCEKVGSEDSFHGYEIGTQEATITAPLRNHTDAIKAVLETLLDERFALLKSLDEIVAVGHRVVHGGEYFSQSVAIDASVLEKIKECIPLAPLHNPPSVAGIEACMAQMPGALQVAVFDTAFHQTLPPKAYMYPLPYEYYEQNRIRRYGFHGTSHRYVTQKTAEFLGRPASELKLVTCHLGNGCSLTAVDKGISIDNSMGFTPLDGTMMGTRCGSIDPAIVTYLINTLDLTASEVETIMNKKSGLLGISGVSNDLRDIRAASEAGNERAALAYQMASHTVKRFIGQYTFEMGGVDAIILCGGVGENDDLMRSMIFDGLETMRIYLDPEKNKQRGGERIISREDSSVIIAVIPTNEELMIVKDAIALLDA